MLSPTRILCLIFFFLAFFVLQLSSPSSTVVTAEEQQCFEEGVECTALAGECCDGLECIADINVATFSADLSCGPRFGPCIVCGEGMVVGMPDADAQLPLPGFTFTCGQLEQAGQFGVFDTTLCQFVPNLISDICGCMPGEVVPPPGDDDDDDDDDASDMPSDMPSMAPSMSGSDNSDVPVPTDSPDMTTDSPDMTDGPAPTDPPSSDAQAAFTMMMSMTISAAVAAAVTLSSSF